MHEQRDAGNHYQHDDGERVHAEVYSIGQIADIKPVVQRYKASGLQQPGTTWSDRWILNKLDEQRNAERECPQERGDADPAADTGPEWSWAAVVRMGTSIQCMITLRTVVTLMMSSKLDAFFMAL